MYLYAAYDLQFLYNRRNYRYKLITVPCYSIPGYTLKISPFLLFDEDKSAHPCSSHSSLVSWCTGISHFTSLCFNRIWWQHVRPHREILGGRSGRWRGIQLISLCQHKQSLLCISRNRFSLLTCRSPYVKMGGAGLNSGRWQRICLSERVLPN